MIEPKLISQFELLTKTKELRDRVEVSMHKLGPNAKSFHTSLNNIVASLSQLNAHPVDDKQPSLFDGKPKARKPNLLQAKSPAKVHTLPTKKKSTVVKSAPTPKPKAKPVKASGKSSAKTTKPPAERKPTASFMAPMQPDAILGEIVGNKAMPPAEITMKLWYYIKKNNLLDANNKRQINPDEKLKAVFDGKAKVTTFEMNELIRKHLTKTK